MSQDWTGFICTNSIILVSYRMRNSIDEFLCAIKPKETMTITIAADDEIPRRICLIAIAS